MTASRMASSLAESSATFARSTAIAERMSSVRSDWSKVGCSPTGVNLALTCNIQGVQAVSRASRSAEGYRSTHRPAFGQILVGELLVTDMSLGPLDLLVQPRAPRDPVFSRVSRGIQALLLAVLVGVDVLVLQLMALAINLGCSGRRDDTDLEIFQQLIESGRERRTQAGAEPVDPMVRGPDFGNDRRAK